MPDQKLLDLLKQGAEAWNEWRTANPNTYLNLQGADLSDARLRGVNLERADLTLAKFLRADLSAANLSRAILFRAHLSEANLFYANLAGADLTRAILRGVHLSGADLRGARLDEAEVVQSTLSHTNLNGALLFGADLIESNFNGASLRGAKLGGANLSAATLVGTDLTEADLAGCRVHGVSSWNTRLEGANQSDLIITAAGEPEVTVDSLEVAQFIYLLLNNRKIRDVINTISQKAVLILGRFSPPERKEVLEAIAQGLRRRGFLPILFDFERSVERDFTETIKILAGLSLFVIADITDPKSSPLELQATVPDYKIPFIAILQQGEKPFSMFKDLTMFDWVLKPVITYESKEAVVAGLENAVIRRALEKRADLLSRRAEELGVKSIEEFLD